MNLDTPCEIWTGAIEKTGYGRRKVNGKMWMAHRYSYQEHYGDLDPDLVADHLCFNRSCVEPLHLRQITREDNAARHKPDCTCTPCQPHLHWVTACKTGHDISTSDKRTPPRPGRNVGDCLLCAREWGRSKERRRRAKQREALLLHQD